MTRDTAINLMDRLTDLGYCCQLSAVVTPIQHVRMKDGEIDDSPRYSIDVAGLGVDLVDVKAFTDLADELGLDVGTRGAISFGDKDERPEVIRSPRQHPRHKKVSG